MGNDAKVCSKEGDGLQKASFDSYYQVLMVEKELIEYINHPQVPQAIKHHKSTKLP